MTAASQDPDAPLEEAARCLRNIAHGSEANRRAVADEGGLQALSDVASRGRSSTAAAQAMAALSNLATSEANKVTRARVMCIYTAIYIHVNSHVSVIATQCVGELSSHPQVCERFHACERECACACMSECVCVCVWLRLFVRTVCSADIHAPHRRSRCARAAS